MNGVAGDGLVVLTCHARDVGADERGALAAALRGRLDGGLILETCHRVEAYVTTDREPGLAAPPLAVPAGGRVLRGEDAARHVVTVAVGGDSVVVGEDQVLHQLRTAVEAARAEGRLDGTLERLVSMALQAGRRARSWRTGPAPSLADVALDAIVERAGPVRDRDVLVVGAGKMARLVVGTARSAGARVAIANRSPDVAAELAAATGARLSDLDPGADVAQFSGVVVAIGGPWQIGRTTSAALEAGSMAVVDLSVPTAVPADLAGRLGRRLVTADELARSEAPRRLESRMAARLEQLIEETTARFLEWDAGRERRAAAEALVSLSDREREAALEVLWRRLPDLDEPTREAIEAMSRRLTSRLLRGPLERLGRDASGEDERVVRELFAL